MLFGVVGAYVVENVWMHERGSWGLELILTNQVYGKLGLAMA